MLSVINHCKYYQLMFARKERILNVTYYILKNSLKKVESVRDLAIMVYAKLFTKQISALAGFLPR